MLKQANTLKDLPSLEEYDEYVDSLWTAGKYRDFIVNYLLRHHYVRNLDLIFDIVTTKAETLDFTKNWLWLDRRNLRCVYIRNTYKTAKTYGQKTVVIDNERSMFAAKRCMKSTALERPWHSTGIASTDNFGGEVEVGVTVCNELEPSTGESRHAARG